MAKKQQKRDGALERLMALDNPAEAFLTQPSPVTTTMTPEPAPEIEAVAPEKSTPPTASPTPTPVPETKTGTKERRSEAGSAPALEVDPELRLYTLKELEGILGLSHRSLLEYVKVGRLRAVKVGNKWKVSRANLLAYIRGE